MDTVTFPSDIKHCMKDCILAVLWPKKAIFGFLQDHGCATADLAEVQNYSEPGVTRRRIVESTFDRLSNRTDGGLGPFRAMLQALVQWSHFDSYYFDKIAKLDRQAADRHLAHLRQLVEIRDSKIRSERQRREEPRENPTATREALLAEYLELFSQRTKPQERGLKFEGLLRRIAEAEKLESVGSFRKGGEQIDGGLKFDGENYIIEAKWHDKSASTTPLYAFAGKIQGKLYGRGVFVSVNGFMPEPVKSLVQGKALHTILVDGEDLILVLEGQITFRAMLDAKVQAAQMRGEIYVHPITKAAKLDH